jgi:hypothetical protein
MQFQTPQVGVSLDEGKSAKPFKGLAAHALVAGFGEAR